MIIIGTYLFITIFSISIFLILWGNKKEVYIDYEEKQYQLLLEMRADHFRECSVVNDPLLRELKSKWIRITHSMDIRGFNRYDIEHIGFDIVEFINKWLTTRVLCDGITVEITHNKDFLYSRINPRIQNTLLAIISSVLLKYSTLLSIQFNYQIVNKVIEVTFMLKNEKNSIQLNEKQNKSIYLLEGEILNEIGGIVILLPNKS